MSQINEVKFSLNPIVEIVSLQHPIKVKGSISISSSVEIELTREELEKSEDTLQTVLIRSVAGFLSDQMLTALDGVTPDYLTESRMLSIMEQVRVKVVVDDLISRIRQQIPKFIESEIRAKIGG